MTRRSNRTLLYYIRFSTHIMCRDKCAYLRLSVFFFFFKHVFSGYMLVYTNMVFDSMHVQ